MSNEQTYIVTGMTCGHCARTIEREVQEVPGVESARVDLAANKLSLTGQAQEAAVIAAIREAGYDVQETR